MAETQIRGKSITAVAKDIAEGFFIINPLTLKKFDEDSIKSLHQQLKKVQTGVRNEKFPLNDVLAIRNRNMRLQRLHQAMAILEHTVRERRIIL